MQDDEIDPFEFGVLDRDADVFVRERNLPHWFQPGAATFITFRTADSLPREVYLRMQQELEQWLTSRGLPIGIAKSTEHGKVANWEKLWNELGRVEAREYNKLRRRLFHTALDECHGECLLKESEVASIIAEAILHGNDAEYDVDRFVIMPNHVHVLAQFRKGAPTNIVGQSWMRFTARRINAAIGRSGCLWEAEPFDHIVRSADQFSYLRWYIANNPINAKLLETEFYYWPQL